MEAEISNYSEEQAEAYYASMKDRWDRYAIEETARKEGKIEGKQEGIVEGKIAGKQEGIKEAKLALALQMKEANEPLEKIILYTGLEKSQIEDLH